jgi:hypothetical protein
VEKFLTQRAGEKTKTTENGTSPIGKRYDFFTCYAAVFNASAAEHREHTETHIIQHEVV